MRWSMLVAAGLLSACSAEPAPPADTDGDGEVTLPPASAPPMASDTGASVNTSGSPKTPPR